MALDVGILNVSVQFDRIWWFRFWDNSSWWECTTFRLCAREATLCVTGLPCFFFDWCDYAVLCFCGYMRLFCSYTALQVSSFPSPLWFVLVSVFWYNDVNNGYFNVRPWIWLDSDYCGATRTTRAWEIFKKTDETVWISLMMLFSLLQTNSSLIPSNLVCFNHVYWRETRECNRKRRRKRRQMKSDKENKREKSTPTQPETSRTKPEHAHTTRDFESKTRSTSSRTKPDEVNINPRRPTRLRTASCTTSTH